MTWRGATLPKDNFWQNFRFWDDGFGFWQLNLSTAQNDFTKFRRGWWQFSWMTGVKFNSIHSIFARFLHITGFTVCAAQGVRRRIWQFLLPIQRDVSSDRAWWLSYREPCVSCQSRASAGLGSPGDSRSHSGHVGNTRRRRLSRSALIRCRKQTRNPEMHSAAFGDHVINWNVVRLTSLSLDMQGNHVVIACINGQVEAAAAANRP